MLQFLRPSAGPVAMLLFAATAVAAPPAPSAPAFTNLAAPLDLWTTGELAYRIPAVCRYDDGSDHGLLLAACEERATLSDSGEIRSVLRTSADGGATWSPSKVTAENGDGTAGNPVFLPDPPRGVVHLIYTTSGATDHERRVLSGEAPPRRTFYTRLTIDGMTWAPPREISEEVRADDWRWYATGPGSAGVVLPSGRLVVSANHSDPANGSPGYQAHVIYSDDGGATWSRTAPIGPNGANETTLAVLPDGDLLMSIRDQSGGRRLFARSTDGGTTWPAEAARSELDGPPCQAGLAVAGGRVLLSLIPDPGPRRGLSVFSAPVGSLAGKDDSLPRWDRRSVVAAGPSAYSALVDLGGGRVGLLYEAGDKSPYDAVRWTTFQVAD
ncbi:sialidase family protein [Alienimonas californiensis]|uniref:exo-alpha-sialidase n=1 Tax=Alienimonas californiensis TaxID=2527989 RepID=A0A517P4X6_9PLAN|nr:sialidase family protein [Alienimonas californiensis]QDT14405.1 Sialidase A precursor [Alienimonas californiensis]